MSWIKEKLHDEVLPVDIDASPEVGKAGGQKIQVMCFWKVKTEHVQQTRTNLHRDEAKPNRKRLRYFLGKLGNRRHTRFLTVIASNRQPPRGVTKFDPTEENPVI